MIFVVMSVETFLTFTAARVVAGHEPEHGLCFWTTMCFIYRHVQMNQCETPSPRLNTWTHEEMKS